MTDITTTVEVPRLLTIKEAAKVLNVSRATLYKLDKQGALNVYTIAGRRQCLADELKSYIETVTGRAFGTVASAGDNSKQSEQLTDAASAVLSQHRTLTRLIG